MILNPRVVLVDELDCKFRSGGHEDSEARCFFGNRRGVSCELCLLHDLGARRELLAVMLSDRIFDKVLSDPRCSFVSSCQDIIPHEKKES